MLFETRKAAEKEAAGNAVIQIVGGYIICSWNEFYFRVQEEAEDCQRRGWKSSDKETMCKVLGFDTEHADIICSVLVDLEKN